MENLQQKLQELKQQEKDLLKAIKAQVTYPYYRKSNVHVWKAISDNKVIQVYIGSDSYSIELLNNSSSMHYCSDSYSNEQEFADAYEKALNKIKDFVWKN